MPLPVVIFAAGLSSRMGRNKLLTEVGGVPLVRRTVEIYVKSSAERVLVVLGHERDRVLKTLEGLSLEYVYNSDFARGKSTSIAAGIRALPGSSPGVMFAQADMPLVRVETVNLLFHHFQAGRSLIVVPAYRGKWGAPKIFDRCYFQDFFALSGESTGMVLMRENRENLLIVDVDDRGVLLDINTESRLEQSKIEIRES